LPDLLLKPGAPFVLVCIVGVLIALYGLMQLERTRIAFAGVRSLPTRYRMTGRFVLGQAAAIPIAGFLLLLAFASGAQGSVYKLFIAGSLALYLSIGVIIPREPIVQAQQA